MLAGRPHEAAGNGSPRWMAAGPRERVHRTRPTGRLARRPECSVTRVGHVLKGGRPWNKIKTCPGQLGDRLGFSFAAYWAGTHEAPEERWWPGWRFTRS